jgi:pimeloyl-ACP methyl ester carboxylesterase
MPHTEINGARIYYEAAGSGEAVVMLHAGIADSRMWNEQFAPFSEDFYAVRYDLRGFGQTTAPAMPYSHHEDLRALLDHLGIQCAALVGCSNGGRVAMNFTLAFPERVTALVMVCSSPGGFKYNGASPALWDEIVKTYEAGDLDKVSRLEAQLWAAGPDRDPAKVDQRMLDLVYEMNLIALKNEESVGEEQPFTPPAAERLGEIRVPTLVIVGEVDSPVTHEAGKIMAQQIAGVKRVDMPDTAHLPSMEHPQQFNEIVMGFLESVLNK